ncbi:MAG: hypothetical protein O7D86_04725 [Proteobacteria bacterium]|nr:hypothetical protein [Pseudomonadota bacterium]
MNGDNPQQGGFKEIKSAPLSNDINQPRRSINTESFSLKKYATALGLIVLVLGVVIVVFYLPAWIEQRDENSNENRADKIVEATTPAFSPPGTVTTSQVSPWDKAQERKLRKEVQLILQEMLEAQKILEQNNINVWANEEYQQALVYAKNGDDHYNQRQYDQSSEQYKHALSVFKNLIEKIDILYNENIQQGQQALISGDSDVAIKSFEMALLLDDDSGLATHGLERARKLGTVFERFEQGNEALAENHLTEAKKIFQSALQLDPETQAAKQKIEHINRLLNDLQFRRQMSTGFTALEQQQYNVATNSFEQALRLQPGSTEAKSAVQQAAYGATNEHVSSLLQQAHGAESEEQWQTAISLYDKALTIDKNLAQAQRGMQQAKLKSQTYQRLQQILSQPERLSDNNVYSETESFYKKISQVKNTGARLSSQILQLRDLLRISAIPVNIRLESDNLTDVVVYKVGKMGIFKSKALDLRPGKYTAVGQREGYRDVRIDFLVSTENKNKVVRIAATEKIN